MVKLTSTPQNTPQQHQSLSLSRHIVPCDMLTYINKKYMHYRRQHRKHMSIYERRQSLTTSKSCVEKRQIYRIWMKYEKWKAIDYVRTNKQLSLSHSYTFITYSIIHKANLFFMNESFSLRIHDAFCWLSPLSTCALMLRYLIDRLTTTIWKAHKIYNKTVERRNCKFKLME